VARAGDKVRHGPERWRPRRLKPSARGAAGRTCLDQPPVWAFPVGLPPPGVGSGSPTGNRPFPDARLSCHNIQAPRTPRTPKTTKTVELWGFWEFRGRPLP